MTENRTYSNAKAKRLLGFQPQYAPAAAVADAMTWYERDGYLPRLPLPPVVVVFVTVWLLWRVVGGIVCGGRKTETSVESKKMEKEEEKKKEEEKREEKKEEEMETKETKEEVVPEGKVKQS